jgi:hypothetical protein
MRAHTSESLTLYSKDSHAKYTTGGYHSLQWQVACSNVRKNVHHICYPQQCVLVSFVTVARAVLAVVISYTAYAQSEPAANR